MIKMWIAHVFEYQRSGHATPAVTAPTMAGLS